jgi:HD superfamily phosphohydrolase
MGEREKISGYLDNELTEPVRDPIWKHIYLAPAHEKIISLPVFQELHAIKQLGPAYLVYPGATHTRFAHSLGTFHIARRLIGFLARRSERPLFTLEGVRAFLAAALLHDLGHYPFAHALKNLGLADHETLTGRLVREEPLAGILAREAGADPQRVAAIVDTDLDDHGDRELRALRRLLSGVLDPDKLDYLNRDAYYCGVPYGVQDVDFFLGEIIADEQAGFAITPKGLSAVESILFSKYLMYKTVYWHKAVRTATAMIRKALLLALRDAVILPDDLYRLTDVTLLGLLERRSYAPFALIREVFERRLYKRAVSIPFREDHPGHRLLCDAKASLRREAEIADRLSRTLGKKVAEQDVIIDIPEALGFEIDLPVAGGKRDQADAPDAETLTIWSGRSADSFTRGLRTVSLMVKRDDGLVRAAEALCRESDQFHP